MISIITKLCKKNQKQNKKPTNQKIEILFCKCCTPWKPKFSDLLRPMSSTNTSAASSSASSTACANVIFEPEVTIRKVFKCCNVERSCAACTLPPAVYLPTTLVPNHKTAALFSPKKVATSLHGSASSATVAGKQFLCTICSFSCTWKYDLKLHLKQKHGVHKK